MTNTTLDAAIEAAGNAIVEAASARLKRRVDIVRPVKPTKAQRTYARALIAKLIEGMEPEGGIHSTDGEIGWNNVLTEIRRRAGIEGGES
jgi:hypothetical protein